MAGEYDFMLPEDRAQKIAELEQERQAWISTRNRGMARFVWLQDFWRTATFVIAWSILPLVRGRASSARALQALIFILTAQIAFNLVAWYRNERRYRREVL